MGLLQVAIYNTTDKTFIVEVVHLETLPNYKYHKKGLLDIIVRYIMCLIILSSFLDHILLNSHIMVKGDMKRVFFPMGVAI